MASGKIKVLALGSTILDVLANVEEEFLSTIEGEKGGMVMIDAETSDRLVARLPSCQRMLGGSAANTLFGLQRLGIPTTMLGKVGTDSTGANMPESAAMSRVSRRRRITGPADASV